MRARRCRYQSSLKEQRLEAEKFYSGLGLKGPCQGDMAKEELKDAVRNALYASKICSYAQVRRASAAPASDAPGVVPNLCPPSAACVYASPGRSGPRMRLQGVFYTKISITCGRRLQGMNVIKAASAVHEWDVDLSEMARIWKGGCIIRAKFLDRIKSAYKSDPALTSLLMDEGFAQDMVRRAHASAAACGALDGAVCACLNQCFRISAQCKHLSTAGLLVSLGWVHVFGLDRSCRTGTALRGYRESCVRFGGESVLCATCTMQTRKPGACDVLHQAAPPPRRWSGTTSGRRW